MTEFAAAPLPAGLATWFNSRWSSNMGAIDGKDIHFIAALLAQSGAQNVLEIGCASGLSTSVIATLMEARGGGTLTSLDLDDRFYADRSKPVGYLLEEAPPHPSVKVSVLTGRTSLDAAEALQAPVELCFIDACHKHPWPLIDTLAVMPMMRAGGIIIHHDLRMMEGRGFHALGPKVFLDQCRPEETLHSWQIAPSAADGALAARSIDDNIFAYRVPEDWQSAAARLAQGFYVGWDRDPSKRVPEAFAASFEAFASATFRPSVARAFEIGLARYNPGAQPTRSGPHRVLRRLRSLTGLSARG